MRIIFFAGKGGVGKTSLSAATGLQAAAHGHKTLILSLDTAHSLSDIFDLKKGILDQHQGKPFSVGKNLWIQELDIGQELKRDFGEIHKYISHLLEATGQEGMVAEDLAILPGMEEISLLLYINDYLKSGQFDVLVLDSAPTGEAVRFISIPTTLEWYMKKLFAVERNVAKIVRPVAEKLYKIPLPRDDYFAAIEAVYQRLKGVDDALTDPAITTVRLVANPEKIVLQETQRAFMFFCLYNMHIDAIVMNRILPGQVKDAYFADWKKKQKMYFEKAQGYFAPVPIFPVDLFGSEVLGAKSLADLGKQVYGNEDPAQRFFDSKPYELEKTEDGYIMSVRLAFADKKDMAVSRTGEELIIRLGSAKRHILLPRHVAEKKHAKARFAEEKLYITFWGEQDD